MRRAQKRCVVPLRAAGLRFKAKNAWNEVVCEEGHEQKALD